MAHGIPGGARTPLFAVVEDNLVNHSLITDTRLLPRSVLYSHKIHLRSVSGRVCSQICATIPTATHKHYLSMYEAVRSGYKPQYYSHNPFLLSH